MQPEEVLNVEGVSVMAVFLGNSRNDEDLPIILKEIQSGLEEMFVGIREHDNELPEVMYATFHDGGVFVNNSGVLTQEEVNRRSGFIFRNVAMIDDVMTVVANAAYEAGQESRKPWWKFW